MERWTQAEELELQRLTERRAKLRAKHLAEFAPAFRDALAPFDFRAEGA